MPETLMPEQHTDETAGPGQEAAAAPAPESPVVAETLVEEVSIDGMCGVY